MKIIILLFQIVFVIGLIIYHNYLVHPGGGPDLHHLDAVLASLFMIPFILAILLLNLLFIKYRPMYFMLFGLIAPCIYNYFELFYSKGKNRFDFAELCSWLTILTILFFIYQMYKTIKSAGSFF